MLRRFILVLAVGLLPLANGAYGANEGTAISEHISSYDSQIHIDHQNVATVTEKIAYNFGSLPHHGIYRTFPTQFKDEKGQNYYQSWDLIGATVDGANVESKKEETGEGVSLRLGDPNRTISGSHTYVIKYKLNPVVMQKADGKGFVNFDVIGTGWNVPIQQATATFSFDDGIQMTNVSCYKGSQGSSEPCDQPLGATGLLAHQGMTINGYLPAGYITDPKNYLVANKPRPLSINDIASLIGLFLGLLVVLGLALIWTLRLLRRRQRRKQQTIIAEYEPPDGLRPAEIGHLQDDTSTAREITATIIDLAVRGYLKIVQTRPKSWWRKAAYRLEAIKPLDDAEDFERTLIDGIFSKVGGPSPGVKIDLDDIDKTAMVSANIDFKKQIIDRLTAKALYGRMKDQHGLLDKAIDTGTVTDAGAAEWAKVEGLKLYLSVAEKDRLKFTDAPERTPERFNKLLPYAVALGVEKEWAKQFKDIDVSQRTTWYQGTGSYLAAGALVDDLSTGFNQSVGSNAVSSGGGSAGGGVGGGGGGSW